jgi:hypothetical protein
MSNIVNRLVVKPQLSRRHQAISIPPTARAIQHKQARIIKNIVTQRPAASQATQKSTKAKPVETLAPKAIAPTPPTTPPPAARRHTIQAVVQQSRSLRNKNTQKKSNGVRYITADVTAYEQEKARNIRGRGTGRILLIIGNGPSINQVPLDLLRNHPYIDTMSVNRPDDRLWPTTYWAFFDQSQYRRHNHLWDSYKGVIFNSTSIKQQRNNCIKLKNLGGFGFSTDLMRGMHIGRSTVYAAMQIALWMDYRDIYILGCDMCEVDGKTHFYGVNPDVSPEARIGRFDKEAEYYTDAADKLDEEIRKRFFFCSSYNQYGFVEKFNKVNHREAVPIILERARTMYL